MKHILITDDDQFLANVCRRKFEEAGFTVSIATDGHAAIEELVLRPPDVVLLDLMLPEIDGLGVLRFIRSREKLRGLPVIVVSNLSYFSGVVQAAWQAGATYFFNKGDCSPASLVETALKVTAHGDANLPVPASVGTPTRAAAGPPPLPPQEREKKPATPAPPAAAVSAGPPPPRSPGGRQPAHILIADDDRVIQGVLTFFLKQAGFIVRAANNGQQALDMAKSEPPDLLVLDGRMPELDGFEVLKLWHQIPGLTKVPVIMLTSEIDDSMKASALGSGAVAYLTKPFSPDDLVARATQLTGGGS
ncbi:PleD family two-component system response regulator [Luteolibacter sp. Populi]|uniref:response regulator n=1 Tax=Luteolibacter sp. Populi TaxID=3230487 RepID=UPI0034650203